MTPLDDDIRERCEARLKTQKIKKAEKRYLLPFVSFKESGDKMLQLVSSLHSSRLSTWGFAAEADVRGIIEYQLTAVLDGRTSEWCRMISGRRFRVEDARRTINEVLTAGPESARVLQPWPSQSRVDMEQWAKLTDEEIVARNWHIPPFHPGCRTMCTTIKGAPKGQKPSVSSEEVPDHQASEQDFVDVGAKLTREQIQHWNDHAGVDPATMLSLLSGASPKRILDGFLKGKPIDVKPSGNLAFKVRGDLETGVDIDMRAFYDPFTGSLGTTYAELQLESAARAPGFLRGLLGNLLQSGKALSAEKLVIASTGSAAYVYASMGAVPNPVAWGEMRLKLLSKIDDGGDLHDLFLAMPVEDQVLMHALLSSNHEDALMVLAQSKLRLGGEPAAKVLLKGLSYDATVDLTDPAKVRMLEALL